MGIQLKAKFNGTCNCGESWKVGDDIFYQKFPKAICANETCFIEQGGVKDTPRRKAFNPTDPRSIIITNVPEVKISNDTSMIADLWRQYFRQAHELTKEVYPQEDVNADRFGMIRQTILNQLVNLAGVIVTRDRE